MKKIILIIILISSVALLAQPEFSKISSMPGAFSRLGFGARGMGMGNAMSSVIEGNIVSYYNPALSVFQDDNSFQTSYSILSLDRSLNFLNFTRRFEFYSSKDSAVENKKPRATAGISLGIINSGVSNIDGRDNQGFTTGELKTSENQFFIGMAIRVSDKLAIGVAAKFYYYKLYEQITSTGLGFDIGALYKVDDNFSVSAVLADLNSKYKWDTSPIYDQDGTISEDKFPLLRKIGFSYHESELGLLASVELENSNAETNILRAGVEYNIYENLFIRAGVDQFNLSNADFLPKPAAGFSYSKSFGSITAGVHYAFMIEQYSPHDRHIVGLTINF